MIGIYRILNTANQKSYIGQSVDIARRWKDEKSASQCPADECYNTVLSKAFRKYGINSFVFMVLEECSREELDEREKYWAEYFDSYTPNGYNVALCGTQGTPNALTLAKVQQIQTELQTSTLTNIELGRKYGVSDQTISDINRGRMWYNEDINYPIRSRFYKQGPGAKAPKRLTWEERFPRAALHHKELEQLYMVDPQLLALSIHQYNFAFVTEQYQTITWCDIQTYLKIHELPYTKPDIDKMYNQQARGYVYQCDKRTHEVVARYDSANDAGRALGDVNYRKHINEVCAGKRNSAYGFWWYRD